MSKAGGLLRRLRMLFLRDRFGAELDEEMAFHRSQAEKDFVDAGLSPDDARHRAMRQFGNGVRLRERSYEMVQFRIESVWQDVRYAMRQLANKPGFTLAVILTLALGIGANTAIFSVARAALLRALPYANADRLVRIEDERITGKSTGGLVTVPRYYDIAERARSFETVSCFYIEHPTLIYGTHMPEQMNGASVTGKFWRVMGVQPLLGRVFDEREDQPHTSEVVVLSYGAWQRSFGGDPAVLGQAVTIERQSATVIGVMPKSFEFPSGVDVWKPTHFNPLQWKQYRGDGVRFVNLIARLKPGVTLREAHTELQLIGSQLAVEHPDTDGPWRFHSLSLRDDLYGELKPALLVLMAASAALLLIACLNVANLLLSRATSRQREIALRKALGASNARIVRQLLTESTCLAMAGGALGLGLAYLLVRVTSTTMPGALRGAVTTDWAVAAFALAISVGTGLLFGSAPIFKSRNIDLNRGLKSGEAQSGGAAGSGLRSAFIATQVGLSLVLLVAACLLGESFWKLTRSPLGFAPDHVLTFEVQLPWGVEGAQVEGFYRELRRHIEALPGVTAVGEASALPTEHWNSKLSYDLDWKPRTPHQDTAVVESRNLGGDYLRAMSIPLLAGRQLRDHDDGAVLINKEFADRFLPGGNPVGRYLLYGKNTRVQIVGIIANIRGTTGSIAETVQPEVYFPSESVNKRAFVVRAQVPPEQLISAVRDQAHRVNPQEALGKIQTLDDLISDAVAEPRLNMALLAGFATIALLLASVGIYGVVAYSVAQRHQEIGVRMALGATRAQISSLFVLRTLRPAAIGLVAGAGAALMLTKLLQSQLYGTSANDPRTFVVAIVLLAIPVLAASLKPALRAASVNPVEVLRAE